MSTHIHALPTVIDWDGTQVDIDEIIAIEVIIKARRCESLVMFPRSQDPDFEDWCSTVALADSDALARNGRVMETSVILGYQDRSGNWHRHVEPAEATNDDLINAAIDRIVASAPPLTSAQRRRLANALG